MSMNVSEFVWQRLSEWGLKRVYGYPGDGVGGLDVALGKGQRIYGVRPGPPRGNGGLYGVGSRQVHRTRSGLCYATSGPGAIHLLNGLYDAKMDHVPVVALVGQQARTASAPPISRKSTCRIFSRMCQRVCRIRQRARAGASSDRPRGAHRSYQAHGHLRDPAQRSCNCLPYEDPPLAHGATHTGVGYAEPGQIARSNACSGRPPMF